MDEVIAYYDQIAGLYDDDRFNNTYGKFIDKQERKILDNLLNKDDEIIVDLACGSGRLLNYATYGVDGSSEMIKIAAEKYSDKKLHISDAENLPFPDQSIDTIISFHFFMHLNTSKVDKILEECNRILKKGGRIILDIPSKKRRNLIKYKPENWHGAFSCTISEIKDIADSNFWLNKSSGILFLPIHRFPKSIRKFITSIDLFFAKSFLKEYSSYIVVELIKR